MPNSIVQLGCSFVCIAVMIPVFVYLYEFTQRTHGIGQVSKSLKDNNQESNLPKVNEDLQFCINAFEHLAKQFEKQEKDEPSEISNKIEQVKTTCASIKNKFKQITADVDILTQQISPEIKGNAREVSKQFSDLNKTISELGKQISVEEPHGEESDVAEANENLAKDIGHIKNNFHQLGDTFRKAGNDLRLIKWSINVTADYMMNTIEVAKAQHPRLFSWLNRHGD